MGFKDHNLDYSSIPVEMKARPNWVCYFRTPKLKKDGTRDMNRDGTAKMNKLPVNPRTLKGAGSTDPQTWTSFDKAVNAVGKRAEVRGISGTIEGVGFVFSGGVDSICGIDLDHVLNPETGELNPLAAELVRDINSYTEISPSGSGLHIYYIGKEHDGIRRKAEGAFGEGTALEMYQSGRFFTVTGKVYGEHKSLSCSESMVQVYYDKYMKIAQDKKTHSPRQTTAPCDLSINEIISAAISSKNGEKFSRLLSGDISDYESQSNADLAFCNLLAFWTGRDKAKMDAIFRQSGLYRDKWDERHGRDTYGNITIGKAVESCAETYTKSKADYAVSIIPAALSPSLSNTRNNIEANSPSSSAPKYSLDDMGNAQRYIDMFGGSVRYCYIDKRWLYYSDKKWCFDSIGAVENLADHAVGSMRKEAERYLQSEGQDSDIYKAFMKHMKASRSFKSRTSMLNTVKHHIPVLPAQLDRYKMALNTPSGVIDLKNGEIKPHSPEYYLTKITNTKISFDECPIWNEFLEEIFGGDRDLISYIQKAVGYSLTGSTAEQCIFFLYGTGKNGKTTFLDTLRSCMGDYATNIQPETIMVKGSASNGINSDIARLKGARFVTSVEPNEGVKLNEGLVKQLTGGDVVTARKLYGDEFEFKPEFKLWMATNHKPTIRGTDEGIWRRIHLIPFTVKIPENKVDRELPQKLKRELPSILGWAIKGCERWQKEGLKMPKAVLDSVREYRREMDVVSAFIEDKCELTGAVQSSVLYACYSQWAQDNNEYCMSATKFSIEISKRFERVRMKSGTMYNGISLI